MFIIFNGNLYDQMISDLTQVPECKKRPWNICRFGLLKAKDKANLGQVLEQKLKASISLFIVILYTQIFTFLLRTVCLPAMPMRM